MLFASYREINLLISLFRLLVLYVLLFQSLILLYTIPVFGFNAIDFTVVTFYEHIRGFKPCPFTSLLYLTITLYIIGYTSYFCNYHLITLLTIQAYKQPIRFIKPHPTHITFFYRISVDRTLIGIKTYDSIVYQYLVPTTPSCKDYHYSIKPFLP
jgi:hypothetical protein